MSSEKVASSAMASTTALTSANTHVELAKGVNGLDKIVLRESRGSSAEVWLLFIQIWILDSVSPFLRYGFSILIAVSIDFIIINFVWGI